MKKILKASLLLALVVILPAPAALQLELTQSLSAAMPIAIMPFTNGSQAKVPGNTRLTTVIKNDLQNSGQFRALSPGLFSKSDLSYWREKGADYVLTGTVTSLPANQFKVSFKLSSVISNKVIGQQAFTVSKAGLRALAHRISNSIYQQLTGVRGIFSTKIAYILIQRPEDKPARYLLEVADEDGFNPQPLLISRMPIMSPSWSPDGKELAYVSFEDDHASIYLQNLATGKRHLISRYPGINGAPAFSSDGTRMAVVLTRTGNPKIYVMNLQTHKLTELTTGYSIDTEPSWAPDNQSLLFTSDRGGNPQIYRYNFADHEVQRLTFDGNYNASAHYLPSERGVVMMHRETGLFGIALQDLSSGQVQILSQTGYDESPSLAPNGKMVLYATLYGGRRVLAVVSTDGHIKLRLPAQEGDVQDPAWSPFLTL